MDQRQCNVPSAPQVIPLKGKTRQKHTVTCVLQFVGYLSNGQGYFSWQSVAGARLDRKGELLGCPPHKEQASSSATAPLRPHSEDFFPKARSASKLNLYMYMETASKPLFAAYFYHRFRLAITKPAAVSAAHCGQRLARAGGVSSLRC